MNSFISFRMNRLCLIWFLIVAAMLAACSPYPRESERMAVAMAQAEAVYDDGNLLVETDTVLFIPGLAEASGYYAVKRQYNKAALAALYNGYTERVFDKEAAMVSFKEAERYGELAGDSLTMARAEYWIGRLLFNEGGIENALSAFKASIIHFGNRYPERAVSENSLAATFIPLTQFDSAAYYLQNCLIGTQDVLSEKLDIKVLNNYAVLYRVQGYHEKSIDCLRKASELHSLDSTEKVFVFLNIGNTFMAKGAVDSAAFYFRQLEEMVTGLQIKSDTRLSIYHALLKYAEHLGNDSLTLQYRIKHEDALYNVMSQRQEQAVYRIQKQYDYETLQNTMNKKIIRRHRIILVFGLLSLVLSAIVLVLQHRHNQMLKAEDDLKRKLNVMKEDLRQTVNTSVVDKILVSQLRNIIVANRTMCRAKDPKNEWRSLLLEVMAGKEDAFEATKAVVETAYPNLLSIIREKHPNLSDTEAKVCLLSCFDLTNTEIAELTVLSVNTVNQNRSILRRKLELGSEKMHGRLRSIIEK